MKKKNESTLTGGWLLGILFFGSAFWLIFNKPVLFFLVWVPVVGLIGYMFVKWLKGGKR